MTGRQQRWCGNKACWDDAGIRMGQGIQSALMKRDKGICACCGLDTVALEKLIREAGRRVSGVGKWRGPYRNASMLLVRFGLTVHEAGKSLWEADHIVPVEEGGGCCGLDNFATLCIWCHKEKTKEQAAARAERNRKKKIVEGNQGNLFD